MKIINFMPIVIVAMIFYSCAGVNTIRNGKGNGEVRTFNVNYDNAWVYSKKIFIESGIKVEEELPESGTLIGSTAGNGSYLGVWVEKAGENTVKLTVYSRRALATTLYAGFTAEDFFKKFDAYVRSESR